MVIEANRDWRRSNAMKIACLLRVRAVCSTREDFRAISIPRSALLQALHATKIPCAELCHELGIPSSAINQISISQQILRAKTPLSVN